MLEHHYPTLLTLKNWLGQVILDLGLIATQTLFKPQNLGPFGLGPLRPTKLVTISIASWLSFVPPLGWPDLYKKGLEGSWKTKLKGHLTLSLSHSTLRKDLGLIFMRRKGQHSTIPSVLSLYIACVRSSPVHFPRKATLLYTFPS